MVDFFKRGVSAKDLRPFSVDDPLGQKHTASAQPARPASPFPVSTARAQRRPARSNNPVAPAEPQAPSQPAAARVARLGCLLVMGLWLMGLFEGAITWVPKFVDRARPVIERLIAEWEQRQQDEHQRDDDGGRQRDPGDPMPASTPPGAPAPPGDGSQPAPPVLSSQPTDGAPAPPQTGMTGICQRAAACCLVVQGARARSLCENFLRLPTSAPCEQAYEVFAQVARDTGRTCQ